MLKVILPAPNRIPPFNEPARDLRIQTPRLWLGQKNMLAPYVPKEMERAAREPLPRVHEATLVHRNNLFFDAEYIRAFIAKARKLGHACRAAFSAADPAFREHALPLS